ncbi:MAG: putative addiction module antidote protein [SAR86 cluster bacterium]|uniref:Putative addiction module antidote protein n=1 Tax=SAR86 cluster bacterium TaxID=2030880 RepID=A0A2A5B052_9GAMM|nr:MAG: putative addiction module antidote protein [SAR86 cluster bacterium]
MKTTAFNPFEFAESQEEINEILIEAFNDEDPGTFIAALGFLAKHYGMTNLARETGLNRESLYKTFRKGTKPQWETIVKLLRALNVKLTVAT